jgi:ribosomal small subunit protein bTHX
MGKGDRKTRRGKINRSSYGKNRKRKTKKKTKSSRAA